MLIICIEGIQWNGKERKEDVKLKAVDLSKCPLGHRGLSDVKASRTGCLGGSVS